MNVLKKDGKILQFTYKNYSPIDSKKYGLIAKRLKYIKNNIPSAYIWEYSKTVAFLPE